MEDDASKKVLLQRIPEITVEPRFRVRIISREAPEADSIKLVLEKPKEFIFLPGQYIWLVLPKRSTTRGIIDRHAYSIASSVDDEFLQLFVRLTHSEYLQAVGNLKVGDEVEIIGPMGSAFCVPPQGAVMISGGTGLAPFMSILKSHVPGVFSLLAYHREEQLLPGEQVLESITQENSHVSISIHAGIPTREQIETVVSPTDARPVLISGPQVFVDHVSELCLSLGVRPDRLSFEALYPTGRMTKELHSMFDPNFHPFFPADESRAMKELPELGELFYMVVKQTNNHVVITDPNGVILFVNEAAEQITGYSFKEMYHQTPRLWGGLMSPAFYKTLWDKKSGGEKIVYEVLNRRKDGRLYVALARITPILREDEVIAYVATEEDITEFRRLDKAKTEFIYLASHQLLTPLSAISWNAETLLDGDAGALSPQQQKYVVEIQQGNQRMVALINALLNVSRIEMGTLSISPEPVQLEAILHSVLHELESSIQENQLQVKQVCAKDVPAVHADPHLLRIIFQNLLSNAVKYTSSGGQVECAVTFDKENFHITVSDSGIGIPKAQQGKLFQKLFRADNAMRKDTHGTGLGLYLVKSIVDRLGGTIVFESVENQGTTFQVSLPLLGIEKKI